MIHSRFELADGRIVTFDELKEQDLPQLIPVFNSIVEEGAYFHRNEGVPNIEAAREWYAKRVEAGMVFIAAKVNNEFIGGASIETREGKFSHVAYFGIYIKKEFRNLGIGTRLIKKIIEVARQKDIKIIQLYVFASNKRAIHTYEKFGFREVGRIKDGVKFQNGTYTDDIMMVLRLNG